MRPRRVSHGSAPPLNCGVMRQTLEKPAYRCRRLSVDSGWMKVRQVLRTLNRDGWMGTARRGSHRQLKHPSKPGRATVPGKLSDELAPGTLNSILKQAGLK
jgi:predicted RNA binding protein YcfA (HicA-like mRNA interferase family)